MCGSMVASSVTALIPNSDPSLNGKTHETLGPRHIHHQLHYSIPIVGRQPLQVDDEMTINVRTAWMLDIGWGHVIIGPGGPYRYRQREIGEGWEPYGR